MPPTLKCLQLWIIRHYMWCVKASCKFSNSIEHLARYLVMSAIALTSKSKTLCLEIPTGYYPGWKRPFFFLKYPWSCERWKFSASFKIFTLFVFVCICNCLGCIFVFVFNQMSICFLFSQFTILGDNLQRAQLSKPFPTLPLCKLSTDRWPQKQAFVGSTLMYANCKW